MEPDPHDIRACLAAAARWLAAGEAWAIHAFLRLEGEVAALEARDQARDRAAIMARAARLAAA